MLKVLVLSLYNSVLNACARTHARGQRALPPRFARFREQADERVRARAQKKNVSRIPSPARYTYILASSFHYLAFNDANETSAP